MNSGTKWRYFIAATLLVLAQLVASWHIPHEHPDSLVSSSDCAIGSVASHLNADIGPGAITPPCPSEVTTVYTIPASTPLARRRSADRHGPRAPPFA